MYKERDADRETVIKRCRDAQKLAKQAIYSLHLGDVARANRQLADAQAITNELLPLLQRSPALRQVSGRLTVQQQQNEA